MLEVNNPISKLVEQLQDNVDLTNIGFFISQGETVNENLNYTPWLGVYIQDVNHNPDTLGTTQRSWKGSISLILVVQATSLKSGADCSSILESYIKKVVGAVINDTTFGNSIDMINKLKVSYSYKNTDSESLYFQEAFITLEVESEHENT